MKLLHKITALALGATMFAACDKVDDLPMYNNGSAIALSASATTLAPSATDSLKTVLTLNWTNPKYAQDSAKYKYVVEIDSAGRNFSKAAQWVITGSMTTGFTAKQLNTTMLAWGFEFNKAYDLDLRVISSYGNNNERLPSNIIKLKATPYKIPPKVALPTTGRLFIVGDASTFGWSNDPTPAFPPARELTRLDETTWGAIMYLNGSGAYKLLQTQGVWNTQYHMVTGGNGLAGSFIQEDADPGFASPTPAGWYKMIFDFQSGKYTVTAMANATPQALYALGDGTVGGWNNAPPANQQFTRLTANTYELTLTLTPGKQLKFISSYGNWQPQFGGTSSTGGTLGANYGSGSDPDAVPTPAVAGNYKISVNFVTEKYTLTKL